MSDHTTILLVDDSSTNNLLYQNILESEGYTVEITENGQDINEKILKSNACLVLLDIMMPGKDGFHTLKNILGNKQTKNIPVIMATSKKDSESMKKALEIGARDYIIKPIGINDLVTRVKNALEE
jgi:DNA-binding response OmpR family regulator